LVGLFNLLLLQKKTNNKKPTHWLAEWAVGDL